MLPYRLALPVPEIPALVAIPAGRLNRLALVGLDALHAQSPFDVWTGAILRGDVFLEIALVTSNETG